MPEIASSEPPRQGNKESFAHNKVTKIEVTIHVLEQRLAEQEEARYEALREVRDALRRAGDAGLRVLETRVRLCALSECEPMRVGESTATDEPQASLRLAHLYFDEGGKYRLALYPYLKDERATSRGTGERGDPIWCSEVVYDSSRPEGKGMALVTDAVRKAYRAAQARSYTLVWTSWTADEQIPGSSAP